MKNHALIISAVFGALVASGCAPQASYSGDIDDAAPVAEVESAAPVTAAVPAASDVAVGSDSDSGSSGDTGGTSGGPRDGLLGERLVFFAYDQSAVTDDHLPVVLAHADYLIANPSSRVILEGHADERGSNEYNLALGQRRADAVRDIMLANGVQQSQIETLSFGEEQPRELGSDESAWAQNRRVEIRYPNE